mmetsp:Transcript_33350/g.65969  ORF Transcript_33350/g.65969 Transcript_33350/m.65969 type:complete len:326 (-) Transcript_33350:430-1407(-)
MRPPSRRTSCPSGPVCGKKTRHNKNLPANSSCGWSCGRPAPGGPSVASCSIPRPRGKWARCSSGSSSPASIAGSCCPTTTCCWRPPWVPRPPGAAPSSNGSGPRRWRRRRATVPRCCSAVLHVPAPCAWTSLRRATPISTHTFLISSTQLPTGGASSPTCPPSSTADTPFGRTRPRSWRTTPATTGPRPTTSGRTNGRWGGRRSSSWRPWCPPPPCGWGNGSWANLPSTDPSDSGPMHVSMPSTPTGRSILPSGTWWARARRYRVTPCENGSRGTRPPSPRPSSCRSPKAASGTSAECWRPCPTTDTGCTSTTEWEPCEKRRQRR